MLLSPHFVLCVCFASTLFSFSVFLKGFMPSKAGLPGLATTTTKHNTNSDFGNGTFLSHKRLVILMVDALRADFVLGDTNYMRYTSDLIKRGETISVIVTSQPPTVTLPRIKAITTGGIPGFIDVVLNFDSTVLNEDNLLAQFKNLGKNLIFFGDDTWLRLFPDVFTRADGTTSFFVSDYTEVDRNVSRHLDDELEREDWDVMILHYLGLDHIGHLAGPKSPLVKPKLQEMDMVVEKLHKKLLQQSADGHGDSLLLLCGDHGMTDQGGHGGSSHLEVSTPAVFISTKLTEGKGLFFNKDLSAQQIDITPSLALLFGLPIPLNNLGMLIPEVFIGASTAEMVMLYQENVKQLWKVLQWNFPNLDNDRCAVMYGETLRSVEAWLSSVENDKFSAHWDREGRALVRQLQELIRKMQEKATLALANYDLYAMTVGILLLWMITVNVSLYLRWLYRGSHKQIDVSGFSAPTIIVLMCLTIVSHATLCTSSWSSSVMCHADALSLALQFICFIIVCFLLSLFFIIIQQLQQPHPSGITKSKQMLFGGSLCEKWLICGSLLHSVSLMSSSYVEEEHQTWYFFLTTFHVIALVQVVTTNVWTFHIAAQLRGQHKQMPRIRHSNTSSKIKQTSEKEPQQYNASKHNTETSGDYVSDLQLSKEVSGRSLCLETDSQKLIEDSFGSSLATRYNSAHKEELNLSKQDYTRSQILNTDITFYANILLVLILCRVARSWNQTGNKWLDQQDVGDWFVRADNKTILTYGVAVSMVIIVVLRGQSHGLVRILLSVGMLGVYSFRAANQILWFPEEFKSVLSDKGTREACLVYGNVGLIILHSVWTYKTQKKSVPKGVEGLLDKLHTAWILTMVLLMRPHNIILTALMTVQERILSDYLIKHCKLSTPALTLFYYWMGQAAFFYQGNSNSVSTVDVSAGYIGLTQYNPLIIGLLMALSTYSGVIFWLLSFLKNIRQRRCPGDIIVASFVLLLCRCVPLSMFTGLVYLQRYHLFVWTVFSPKLLYEGMLSLIISGYTLCQTIL